MSEAEGGSSSSSEQDQYRGEPDRSLLADNHSKNNLEDTSSSSEYVDEDESDKVTSVHVFESKD